MKQKWFKVKTYGWGWTPATWQGWLMIALFVAALISNAVRLSHTYTNPEQFASYFVPETFLLTIVLLVICVITGEKPGWHWGKKN